MSGFEVAGVVLGTLPLVIQAIEAYIGFIRDWGKVASELKSINRQLTTERCKLYNICDQLLSDIVPQKDVEPMLEDPFGPLWQAEETKKRLRRRLRGSYHSFEATVIEIYGALQTVQQRLRVDVTRDGQVKWVERRWMPREFRKFLYRLNRKDYEGALSTISKGANDLESLTRLSVALESTRRKRSGCRAIGMLRDLSSSVYRALRSSILCSDIHDVSLGLTQRFAHLEYEDDDEALSSDIDFRMAISFEAADRESGGEKDWDEVKVMRQPVLLSEPPPRALSPSPGMTREAKRTRVVAFATKARAALVTSAKSPIRSKKTAGDTKFAMANVTQLVQSSSLSAETTTICPSDDSTETLVTDVSPVNLCRVLSNACGERPVCYGYLADPSCPTHRFKMYPLATTINDSGSWSVITLEDVLWKRQGLQPLLWLDQKVSLALAVACAVLQLSKTPWLPEPLAKNDLHFFNRDGLPGYQQPFLRRQIPEPEKNGQSTTDEQTPNGQNYTVFRLGILLLEIILGSALESLCEPHEKDEYPGDRLRVIRDSITAHRLLQTQVASISPAYKAVVERCVGYGVSQGLGEEDFRERVYSGVVVELEAILEYTKLS